MTAPSRPPSTPGSSRIPAGVPSGSNAKYAVVAVVLVAGVAGLLWMRSSGAPQATAPQPPAPPVASASANPKLDDIPPPPPPEEEAPKPTGSAGPKIIYLPANYGCDGKCSGSAPPELGQALQV